MPQAIDPAPFRLAAEEARGLAGKRLLVTGAGRHGGLGQAFALTAGLSGAASVGVHFHRSYADGLETVEAIRAGGGRAFPVQADVTSAADLWASRGHVMRQMDGAPPDIVICNSGLTEKGYLLGRAPRPEAGEPGALRRARARQAFVDNLEDSHEVLRTKIDGFLGTTHLWAGEAVFASRPLTIVYVSSRQALDPGGGVPGYVAANWAVLALPKVLEVNLGKSASLVTPFAVCLPFVRTGMTEALAENPKVFGRWQPRMLEPHEAARALAALLARPREELSGRAFQLDVAPDPDRGAGAACVTWSNVRIGVEVAPLAWSAEAPLQC